LFELRLDEQGFSVDAAEEKGRPLPDWYTDAPAYLPGDQWFLTAFWKLSTCRAVGMTLGPIPVTAIWEFSARHGLDSDMSSTLEEVLARLDRTFLAHISPREKRQKPRPGRRGS